MAGSNTCDPATVCTCVDCILLSRAAGNTPNSLFHAVDYFVDQFANVLISKLRDSQGTNREFLGLDSSASVSISAVLVTELCHCDSGLHWGLVREGWVGSTLKTDGCESRPDLLQSVSNFPWL